MDEGHFIRDEKGFPIAYFERRWVTREELKQMYPYAKIPYTFAEYHGYIKASVLPQYPSFGDNLVYPTLGQSDETGELIEKLDMLARKLGAAQGKLAGYFKKLWRDHGIQFAHQFDQTDEREKVQKLRDGAVKEIGDILWYLDALSCTLGTSLEECAQLNVEKLTGRAQRGTSLGSGDDR